MRFDRLLMAVSIFLLGPVAWPQTPAAAPTGAAAYAIMANSGTSVPNLRIFGITPLNRVLVQTSIQDPIGTYQAGRIIRIRDASGPGNAIVEVDTAVTSGPVYLSCTDAQNYIEIGLELSGGTPVKWDVREMQG